MEDTRMNMRTQVLIAIISIFVTLSSAGCNHGHSKENYLIWRVIKMPDGSKGVTYKGVADAWALNTLRKDTVHYGTESLNEYAATPYDPGMRDDLVAVRYPPVQQKDRIESDRIGMRQLFPPYRNFSIANMFEWVSIYRKFPRNDKAISKPIDAVVTDQLDASAYFDRGYVHTQNGRYERAISDYNKAIEMNPKYAKAFNNRGAAYYMKGQKDPAILDYSKAIEINPNFADAFYNRGVAYYSKGQQSLAISDYARAIEINPQLYDQNDMFIQLIRKIWTKFKESKRY